jgi:ribosomal protein S20
MSEYETALRRYRRAVSSSQAAEDEAAARTELDEAARVLDRFAIDPDYRGPRVSEGAAA